MKCNHGFYSKCGDYCSDYCSSEIHCLVCDDCGEIMDGVDDCPIHENIIFDNKVDI